MTVRKTIGYTLALTSILALWGCGEVRPRPPSAVLLPGETLNYTAVSATGSPVAATAWSSSSPDILQIDSATGRAIARQPGKATVRCQYSTATCYPADVEVAAFDIDDGPDELRPGVEARYTAERRYSDGRIEPLTVDEWQSSNPGVVDITRTTGRATGGLAGEATITARAGTARGSKKVTVPDILLRIEILVPELPWGKPAQLEARGYYARDPRQPVTISPRWESSDSDVLGVSQTGIAVANRAGDVVVSCSREILPGSSERARTSKNLILPNELLSLLVVSPPAGQFYTGETLQLQARGVYSKDPKTTVTVSPQWDSSNAQVVKVDSQARQGITLNPGKVTIECRIGTVRSPSVELQIGASSPRLLGAELGKEEARIRRGEKASNFYELDMIERVRQCYAGARKKQPDEVKAGFLPEFAEDAAWLEDLLKAAGDDDNYAKGESRGKSLKTGKMTEEAIARFHRENIRPEGRSAQWAFGAGLVKGYASITRDGQLEPNPTGEARDSAKAMYGVFLNW